MPIYNLSTNGITKIPQTNFQSNGILERDHLQKFIRDKIDIISEDTLIISEEFSDWDDSRRRIDLLGIDKEANLVVIELKRTETGDHMELQALRYASMVSTMNFNKCISIYQNYIDERELNIDAKEELMIFLDWDTPLEDEFASNVKIVLASADFSKELTTSVMWLLSKGIDITCIKLSPYLFNDEILLDINQIIPLPEAESYLVKIKEKNTERQIAIESTRDKTKYLFNDKLLGKGRLVFEVIKYFTEENKQLTFEEIEKKFPSYLQGSTGVVNTLEFVNEKYQNSKRKRHFIDQSDILKSADGIEFLVSTEWGIGNINKFINLVRAENYDIQEK
ncbi:hypothetical protein HXZ94_14955 [Empedobacter falsenii]|uniref:hypothetical protein n=1 Tax=Empedobacter falsenii TaxID=343874 RepID=UPI0025782EC9|nr:hypothetical protein [Empedobacter falsenii]MDM1299793.1 hypothetical protein [Empedobacter falsenii]MDM1319586.1 hypothetical protein [Empedobacter falsenii]